MRKIQEKFGTSLFVGDLPTGCQFCHSGSKIVLFITGLCERPPYCRWYCPISLERRGKDLSFVNEVQITSEQDIINEAQLIDAKGAAITGGEPITHFKRIVKYINLLKNVFGDDFHIHLYTNSINLSKSHLTRLKNVGLDEIRLHPSPKNWNKIEWCVKSGIDTGVEIPVIPNQFQKIKDLIQYLEKIGVKFLNLNEFEITESNSNDLKKFGYSLKENTIAAVKGSEKLGLKVLKFARSFKLNIHYCSIGYKDGIQLKNRFIRRAKNIVRPHETISDEGLLVKGIIFQENVKLPDLENLRRQIIQKFGISNSTLIINREKTRLEISMDTLKKIEEFLKQKNFTSGTIEELPLDGKNRIQMTFTPS
ncbi:MAG: radical SAM protein [Candidatus Helarchaeota archaeon]|nr:radical SAM protein [Candidatus Helarchaeota archaeon]